MALVLVSAGAAKGVVEALASRFTDATGERVDASFGAVGAMKERLLTGARCDAVILTLALLEDLARDGRIDRSTMAPLGRVATGIAVRERDDDVPIESPDALRRTLREATSLYCPDTRQATAGIHFKSVLTKLGVHDEVVSRMRTFPNGAAAMAALALAADARPCGCTQVTEILYTPRVRLVGKLPSGYGLETVYAAAVCADASDATMAQRFVRLLTGTASSAHRSGAGFE